MQLPSCVPLPCALFFEIKRFSAETGLSFSLLHFVGCPKECRSIQHELLCFLIVQLDNPA